MKHMGAQSGLRRVLTDRRQLPINTLTPSLTSHQPRAPSLVSHQPLAGPIWREYTLHAPPCITPPSTRQTHPATTHLCCPVNAALLHLHHLTLTLTLTQSTRRSCTFTSLMWPIEISSR